MQSFINVQSLSFLDLNFLDIIALQKKKNETENWLEQFLYERFSW